MAVRHLTDEQIQRYLDGDISCDSDEARHLQKCAACQREVQSYRKVYEGLGQDIGFELSPGFTESVMTRLAATAEENSRLSLANLFLVIFGTIVMASLALYFLSMKTITENLMSLSSVATSFGSSVINSLNTVTASLGVSTGLMLFTVIILTMFAALDRILLRYRGGNFCL